MLSEHQQHALTSLRTHMKKLRRVQQSVTELKMHLDVGRYTHERKYVTVNTDGLLTVPQST